LEAKKHDRKDSRVARDDKKIRDPKEDKEKIPLGIATSLANNERRERSVSISHQVGPSPRYQNHKRPPNKKDTITDPQWGDKFDIPKNEAILIKEFACTLEYGYSIQYNGILYMTPKYLCYFSEFFGLSTKEVVPITTIERCRRKDNSNTLSIKVNKKRAARFKPRSSHPHIWLIFSTYNECTEALQIILKLWEEVKKENPEDDSESPRTTETFIQREIRQSVLDKTVPNIELKPSASVPAFRIYGPKQEAKRSDLGNEISAMSISTYPRLNRDQRQVQVSMCV